MLLPINQRKITWFVRRLRTSLKGKDAVLKLFSTRTVFAFPRCDCGTWRWIGRSTWLVFNFVFFLHWIGAAQRPSFINQFVVVVVQWKAARCRIHLRSVMVRYGLAKVLRGVKALQTRKKSANGFENLLLQGLVSQRQLKSTKTEVCGFFVAAGMAFSAFFCCFVCRKLAKSTFFRRFVREKFCCFPYKVKLRFMSR